MQHALPNTVLFAVVVGIGGYLLSFFWPGLWGR